MTRIPRFPGAVVASVLIPFMFILFSCGKPETEDPGEDDPQEKPVEKKDPVLTIADASVRAKAGTYQIPFTLDNPVEGKQIGVSFAGESASWISLGTPGATSIPVTVQDNLSAPRSTQLKISYQGLPDKTITITQDQWEYSEFNISISNVGPFGATFQITRKPGYTGGYFFEVLEKSAFEKYVKGETNSLGDFAYGEAAKTGLVIA